MYYSYYETLIYAQTMGRFLDLNSKILKFPYFIVLGTFRV